MGHLLALMGLLGDFPTAFTMFLKTLSELYQSLEPTFKPVFIRRSWLLLWRDSDGHRDMIRQYYPPALNRTTLQDMFQQWEGGRQETDPLNLIFTSVEIDALLNDMATPSHDISENGRFWASKQDVVVAYVVSLLNRVAHPGEKISTVRSMVDVRLLLTQCFPL